MSVHSHQAKCTLFYGAFTVSVCALLLTVSMHLLAAVTSVLPDLDVSQSDPATIVQPSKGIDTQATYKISVKNKGSADMKNVMMMDVLPPALTVRYIDNTGCKIVGAGVMCALGTMKPGNSKNISLTLGLKGPATCRNFTQPNYSFVWGNVPETNLGNNRSLFITTFVCAGSSRSSSSSSSTHSSSSSLQSSSRTSSSSSSVATSSSSSAQSSSSLSSSSTGTASTGNLFISNDLPARSHQMLGGSLSDWILRLQFRALGEDIDVTRMVFTAVGQGANTFAQDVDHLALYEPGGTSPFAAATVGGCGSDVVPANSMCAHMNAQQFVIPNNLIGTMIVQAVMKADANGAVSGDALTLSVQPQVGVQARGVQSGNQLAQNNGDNVANGEVFTGNDTVAPDKAIVSNANVVILAKITSITNANPDPDNTNVPTGVTPFGQFTFTAAANSNTLNGLNKATLSGIVFTVNATNVNLNATAFKFYNKNDASTKANCTAYTITGTKLTGTVSGTFMVDCSGLKSGVVDTRIGSAYSLTFVLEGNITNPLTSTTSSLQASLQNFTTLSNVNYGVTGNTHIEWMDEDFGASTLLRWIDYPETTIKSTLYHD